MVAVKEYGALYKDLDHVDGHTGQDSRLVAADEVVVVARDDLQTRCYLDDGGNGTRGEDMETGDMLDGDSILHGQILRTKSAGGDHQARQVVGELDGTEEQIRVLYDRTLHMFQ